MPYNIPRTKACLRCGQPFSALMSTAKWCSGACKERARIEGGARRVSRAKPLKHFTCVQCDAPFESNQPGAKYCSAECKRCANMKRKESAADTRSWELFDEVVVLRLVLNQPVGEREASYPEIAAWSLMTGLDRNDQVNPYAVYKAQSRKAVCEEWITSPYDEYRELARVALERWK